MRTGSSSFRIGLAVTTAIILLLILAACQRSSGEFASPSGLIDIQAQAPPAGLSTPTIAHTATPLAEIRTATPIAVSPTRQMGLSAGESLAGPTVTPFWSGENASPCGQLLPILAGESPVANSLRPDAAALPELTEIVPEAASPALERLLIAPETVGLAAYRVGDEEAGAYLNADVPMPLASVVKLINLVAYVEAAAAGRLHPNSIVTIDELERYYIPGLDLGAHRAAVKELEAVSRILPNPPSVRLEEIPWMMIRHSSNAAADYLHLRLGQTTIEETAVALGLTSQTAPCPFLGQFLAMSNHTRAGGSDVDAVLSYIEEPRRYGNEAMQLAQTYANDALFRQSEIEDRRRPSIFAQRLFSDNLNPKASAREYAALIARIAQNGLSNAESSFLARRYLEWPMRFPVNQELFSNLGYKNGAMPGVLTTVYYAYRIGESAPVVVALFYRDLPNRTYQRWRRNELAHDEFARWLLYDPAAIPALKAVLDDA